MKIIRNYDARMIGAAEYISKYVDTGNWTYPQPTERRWNEHRCVEICRSINEGICLGMFTIEIKDDGHLESIVDGQERTAVLYEMLHPEVRKDKRLLMIIGKDEYEVCDFVYVDADYSPRRPYEYWVSVPADTLSLACLLNEEPFRSNKIESTYRHVKEQLMEFNKKFQSHTLCLSLVSFEKQSVLDESIEIQKLRLRGRLNRT